MHEFALENLYTKEGILINLDMVVYITEQTPGSML